MSLVTQLAALVSTPSQPDTLEKMRQLLLAPNDDAHSQPSSSQFTAAEVAELLHAAVCNASEQSDQAELSAISLLLSLPSADVNCKNVKDIDSPTVCPLHRAVYQQNYPLVDLLLKQPGVSVDARDAERCTSLHYAALNSDVQMAKMLLSAGADVNARDAAGETALIRSVSAAAADSLEKTMAFVALLVERGALMPLKSLEGRNCLMQACAADSTQLIDFLLDAAVKQGGNECAASLLLAKDNQGLTAADVAAELHQLAVSQHVKKLMAAAKEAMQ